MTVLRARRGIVLSLLGMAGLSGRLGPRSILSTSPFAIVERVTLRNAIARRAFVLKSSAVPMKAESSALYWVGEHVVSACRLLAAEPHQQGEWVLMTQVPHEPLTPSDERGITEMVERVALFHSLTLGYPFPNLTSRDASYWKQQQPLLLERLQRLQLLPPEEEKPELLPALDRAISTIIEMLEHFTPEHYALVHGELDVSNIVITGKGAQALDWELAHVSLPIVDLARLLDSARLSHVAKDRVAARYFNTLLGDWPYDPATLRRLGSLLNRLHLLDWHSRAIQLGIAPLPPFRLALDHHIHALAHAF